MGNDSWFKTFGCLGTIVAALFVGVFALVVLPSIEDSKATAARAEADIEGARAAAVVAEAEADVQMQLDRQAHELALLREENRQFQERLVMLATVIEGMEKNDASTLARWLGLEGTSPTVVVLAALLAALTFATFLVLRHWWQNWGPLP